MDLHLFAACAPGLEPLTEAELRALGAQDVVPLAGGVEFRGSERDLLRANLWLRTASRVLVRLGAFRVRDFERLRRRARELPFESCLAPDRPLRIAVSCSRSRLNHTGAVAERVRLAIADRLGAEPPVAGACKAEAPDADAAADAQLVLVRLVRDDCVVSVDASGPLLHQRGWRGAAGKAPLRETLAAALLIAAGWDGTSPLLDPFCGSGTIPIEAALLACRVAPGRNRRFACMDWPGFDAALFARLCAEADAEQLTAAPAICGSDRDPGIVEAARENAVAAGVADVARLDCCAISKLEPPAGPGLVASNPPYGVRLRGGGDLRNLYARFGAVLRERCPGWRVAILCGDRRLARATSLPLAPRGVWRNGGLRVELCTGVVPGGA